MRASGVREIVCKSVFAGLEDDIGSHAEITGDDQLDELACGAVHQRPPAVMGDEANVGAEQHEDVVRADTEDKEGKAHDEERQPAAGQHAATEPALQQL